MKGPALSDETFGELADYVYSRTGIHMPPSKKYLMQNRLLKVIEDNNLGGYDDFLTLIRYSPNGREVIRLFDAITTNETYFFREPQHFDVLTAAIVSRVLEQRRVANEVRIWSAACSTGDEPYTVAMAMRERRATVRTDILASDISQAVLRSARRAVYSSYAVRSVPEHYLWKYFRQEGEEYVLDASVKAAVRFESINLMEGRGVLPASMDVIFCRNVLIYFDDSSKRKAVSFLYDSLRPGGYLFIGSSESLHNVTKAFLPVTIDRVLVYRKN